MAIISKDLLNFLSDLSENNNREWFADNKSTFKSHESDIKLFQSELNTQLNINDNIASHKLMRIYRDVRFSKDKTPYRSRFAGSFIRASEQLRGRYFMSIEPNNTVVGGGFYGPNTADLKRIRKEFEVDDSEMREILAAPNFKKIFISLLGDEVKTAPRDFDKNHPAIDLIKKKQFYFFKSFTDEEVLLPSFQNEVLICFETLRPFFDYMSDVLTTDLNGVSILDS